MASLTTYGSAAAGAGLPLATRTVLDEAGSSLTRPSVLAGVGLGVASLGASYAVSNGMIGAPVGTRSSFVMNSMLFGVTSLTTGVLSAFTPSSGAGFQLPSA